MPQPKKQLSQNSIFRSPTKIHNLTVNRKVAQSLLVPDHTGYQVISLDHIRYIQSNGNYSEIILEQQQSFICSKTLKTFELILPNHFFRIHHQYIINKRFVHRIENAGKVMLDNNTELPLARSRKKQFINWFIDTNLIVVE